MHWKWILPGNKAQGLCWKYIVFKEVIVLDLRETRLELDYLHRKKKYISFCLCEK